MEKFLENIALMKYLNFNLILGNMTIVGPRPALPKQFKLINSRKNLDTQIKPGVTGYAQVHGRDLITDSKN